MLKYMWPGFLSNIATNLATNQLNNLFAKLSRTIGSQAIFRMALSQLGLRELSLGATPPRFENVTVRCLVRDMSCKGTSASGPERSILTPLCHLRLLCYLWLRWLSGTYLRAA